MSYAGNSDSATTGFCPAPPPPPPPPPTPGQVPALKINTAEAPRPRRPQSNNDPYEPPAAIQNAMMTKDKKPFTYTPGMGGKLDLSQIRSPRMARRVAKNANDEGIEGPPKSALESKPTPSTIPGNIYVQPQVAVPVFPTNLPAQPNVNRTPSTHVNRVPSNVSNSQYEPPRNVVGNEGKVTPITIVPSVPTTPQSPTTPPQVTLSKAPTPWLQNKAKQSEELPEWAKRASANANKPIEVQSSFNDNLPAATNVYQLPQQQQIQSFGQPQNTQNFATQRQQDRAVPVRIEDRPSVFSVKNEPAGHHQFKQAPNQQQRWGQPSPQPQQQYQQQQQQQQHNPQSGGTRIIPIMVEDNNGQSLSQGRTIPVDVQGSKIIVQRGGPAAAANQPEPGPVQSRSFRVLQKITDTDSDTDVDGNSEQIRKLQLTEDDKILMNKFKDQVDGENYLHQEEDPRYRGAAIPSRAFRFLQNMTDSGEVPSTSNAPRPASAINKKQNRNSKSFEEAQANLPASEQQVQEPKKYMGSAIPSRSFRILQAMTSPENIAPQENRQQENFTSRTENSVTGNQQSGVFFPPNCPPSPAYWNPENGWWGYYPVQYATQNGPNGVPSSSPSPLNVSYNPYAYCNYGADPNSFAYYPVYDQNYPQNYNHNQINDQNYQIHGYLPMNVYPAAEQQQTHSHEQNWYEKNNNNYEDKVYTKENDEVKRECKEVKEDEKPLINVNEVSTIVKEPTKNNNSKYLTVPKWTKSTTSPGRTSSNDESKKLSDDSKTETESDSDTDSDSSDTDSDSSSDSESSDDSSDSSTSSSDNESTSEYHAYVNELKIAKVITRPCQLIESPKLQPDKDCFIKSLSGETISEDAYEHSSRLSSEKLSCSDCDSDADDEYQIESLNNDCILPHQLSVIYEDAEHTETESESRKLDSVKELAIKGEDDCVRFSETAGDPPDDNDHTTVSVSLPLRFKFSVSENNEDVTTVIVGDSTIKSAARFDSEDSVIRGCGEPDENNEVHVNFNIKNNNNTSVDFTLKKHKGINDESFDTEFTLTNEESKFNLSEKRGESLNAKISIDKGCEEKDENANLKNDFKLVECNENVETEFTIRKKKTDVVRHVWKKDLDLDEQKEIETTVRNEEPLEATETEYTVRDQTNNSTENGYDLEYEVTTSKAEMNENIHKEIIEQESLKVKEREIVQTEFGVKKIHKIEENNVEDEADDKNFDYTIVQNFNTARRLLSVQNSRDETDDEDSGVTSDMSRIISEVDTDSECASIKRMNKYQRTQTHSRLFKLLNDDAVLAEEDNSSEEFYSPGRREHLSLPLKSNVFNYDENNYYSNYSSGITSPDYSPLCEQSWRRIHEGRSIESENSRSSVTTPNDCVDHMSSELANNNLTIFGIGTTEKPAPNEDPYFQTWKKVASPVEFDYDILPSIAFKKLKNGMANFNAKGNRINVLCPRIKSSKNVPKTLQVSQEEKSSRKTTASSIPFLSTISSLKNGHC